MESITLSATKRDERGKENNQLRRDGKVPAIVYGHNQEPISIVLERKAFDRAYKAGGENTIITLNVDGVGEVKTLIKDVFRDPVADTASHVDFMKINLKEKLETAIPVEIVGESPAVKNLGGVLIHNMTELQVRCLPTDLVHSFQVDISSLIEFGDMVLVSQIKVPNGIELLTEPENPVVSVSAPKAEEAASIPSETVTPTEVPTTAQKSPEELAAEADAAGEKKDGK